MHTVICAHAAGADLGPANSIRAAQASLAHLTSQDLIEIDVQETRDGELVLIHGSFIDSIRFALSRASCIKELSLHAVRQINPATATLEEMLKYINGRCGVVLDIKDQTISLGKVFEIVDHSHTGETFLTAARSEVLRRAKESAYPWPRVAQCRVATRKMIDEAIALCEPHIIDIWPPFISEYKVHYVRDRRLHFVPGGMNKPFSRFGEDPNRLRQYVALGAKYVVTFDPEQTKRILESA